jgi:hypothetical protein
MKPLLEEKVDEAFQSVEAPPPPRQKGEWRRKFMLESKVGRSGEASIRATEVNMQDHMDNTNDMIFVDKV